MKKLATLISSFVTASCFCLPAESQSMQDAYNQQKKAQNERFLITKKCDRIFITLYESGRMSDEFYCVNGNTWVTRCVLKPSVKSMYCDIQGLYGEKNYKGDYIREFSIVNTEGVNGEFKLLEFWCNSKDNCPKIHRKYLGSNRTDWKGSKLYSDLRSIPDSWYTNRNP